MYVSSKQMDTKNNFCLVEDLYSLESQNNKFYQLMTQENQKDQFVLNAMHQFMKERSHAQQSDNSLFVMRDQ